MAQITINEVSSNYNYSVGATSFCTVAMPMTASWGPAYEDPATLGIDLSTELENTAFSHFPATQAGLEAFMSTYRGPATNYRSAGDYSYQFALTLLTAGYDLDICRVCPGTHAQATIQGTGDYEQSSITFRAKYPGTFGNNLVITFDKVSRKNYWNMIVYVVDSAGTKTAVENLVFVLNIDDSTDSILYVDEVNSNYVDIIISKIETDDVTFAATSCTLVGGTDRKANGTAAEMLADARTIAKTRYDLVPSASSTQYLDAIDALAASNPSIEVASRVRYMEWVYTATFYVLDILTDKLAYTSSRLVMPGWDDQNPTAISGDPVTRLNGISPLHAKMMDIAYDARCCASYIDIPKCLPRAAVYNDSSDPNVEGYAQKISRYVSTSTGVNDGLFASHSAIFAPWGQYMYVGTSRFNPASPSFLALMIQIAMIKNQSLQYEWAMPTTRKHNLQIGKLDYVVPKKILDEWQSIEGTAINVIADIPDLGVSVWGNSTAYEVPVATSNALQNLSTRWLVNAIKNLAYRCGIAITFQYNNDEAYSRFYAGVSPLLDTMKNVGAIEKYTIEMSADINGLDQVNFNSVIGTIKIWVYGVINNITVDLIALPAGTEDT